MLDIGLVPAFVAVAVPVIWLALCVAFLATDRGFDYALTETRDKEVETISAGQPTAISIAALVFAGLALIGSNAEVARLSDLLLVSLACFVFQYIWLFWPGLFTSQLASDALEWTGLAVFLAAVYEYAVVVSPGTYGRWAVVLVCVGALGLAARAAYAHWHNAVALSKAKATPTA